MKLLYNMLKISEKLFIIYYLYYNKKYGIIKLIKKLIINLKNFSFIYNGISYID